MPSLFMLVSQKVRVSLACIITSCRNTQYNTTIRQHTPLYIALCIIHPPAVARPLSLARASFMPAPPRIPPYPPPDHGKWSRSLCSLAPSAAEEEEGERRSLLPTSYSHMHPLRKQVWRSLPRFLKGWPRSWEFLKPPATAERSVYK